MESGSLTDRVPGNDNLSDDDDGSQEISETKCDDFDENNHSGKNAKKPRIVYDKEFLLECFFLPHSRQKPADFPLPNLGCTLGSIKIGNSPFTPAPPYLPPKRKEELGRRERDREPDDNISLRPHSGNFSGGCVPILPSYGSKEKDSPVSGGLQQILDDNFFLDHGRNNNHRFTNRRNEYESPRGERVRDRDPRDIRDRDITMSRDRDRDNSRSHRDRDMRGDVRDRDRDLRDNRDRDRDLRDNRDRDRDLRDNNRDRELRDNRNRDRDIRDIKDSRGERDRDNKDRDRDSRDNRDRDRDLRDNRYRDNRYRDRDLDGDRRDRNGRGSYSRKEEIQREITREYRRNHHEAEPEWFSGGPSSQHETIELRGFMDDERREKVESKDFPTARDGNEPNQNGSPPTIPGRRKSETGTNESPKMELMSLEKIFQLDIPGILPNGAVEEEAPRGVSRFSQIFQRNSSSNAVNESGKGQALLDQLRDAQASTTNIESVTEDKETEVSKEVIAEELGNALRNILLNPAIKAKTGHLVDKLPEFPSPKAQPQKKTEKPAGGCNMLQALLDKMIDPVGTSGRSSTEMGMGPGMDHEPAAANNNDMPMHHDPSVIHASAMHPSAIPSVRPEQQFQQQQVPQNIIHRPNLQQIGNGNFRALRPMSIPISQPVQINPFQVFENLIRQPHPQMPQIPQISQNVPREALTPQHVMGILPPEIQYIVQHVNVDEAFWSQPDSRPLVGAMQAGNFTFRKLLEDLINPTCARKHFLASLMQLILSGSVNIPSLTIIGQPMMFHKNPQMHNHVQNHRVGEDGDYLRRCITPVSMTIPTSVMRKMTGDSPKPSSTGNLRSSPINHGAASSDSMPTDFSMIVQQLTGHNTGHPHHIPQPMNAAQFRPIHPQMMITQQGPRMMMHPNFAMAPPQQSVMNFPHPHREMPQS